MNRKSNKVQDDIYLYCKATKEKYFWGAYSYENKRITSGFGSGDFDSVIDATYQAIYSGLDSIRHVGNNRRVKVVSDIQFVVNQLQYNEPLSNEELIIKHGKIMSISKIFSHIRWTWLCRDELIHYIDSNEVSKKRKREINKQRPNYYEYIQSDEWKKLSKKIKSKAGYRCQVCNRSEKEVALNTHHRTYERLGHEKDSDLICLCRDCHELFEKNSKHRPASR